MVSQDQDAKSVILIVFEPKDSLGDLGLDLFVCGPVRLELTSL